MIGWDELDIYCGAVEQLLADATDQVLRPLCHGRPRAP